MKVLFSLCVSTTIQICTLIGHWKSSSSTKAETEKEICERHVYWVCQVINCITRQKLLLVTVWPVLQAHVCCRYIMNSSTKAITHYSSYTINYKQKNSLYFLFLALASSIKENICGKRLQERPRKSHKTQLKKCEYHMTKNVGTKRCEWNILSWTVKQKASCRLWEIMLR